MAINLSPLIALLLVVACGNRDAPKVRATDTPVVAAAFSYADHLGWWHGRCLAISNDHITSGTPVTLIVTGTPQVVRSAKVGEHVNSGELCAALKGGRATANAKPDISFYALQADSIETTDMGIGITSTPIASTVVNGRVEASLLQDQHKNVFTTCATSEGMKFAVWVDKAYVGEPLWSGYYYLDYDTTPTCP